jgi:hypothetical protein
MKISEEVRKALARYPYIEEYLAMGVINHRALAREIRKYLKGGEVNLQSVVSAIRRASFSKSRGERNRLLRILSKSEVNLKYDLATATIVNQKKIEEVHKALREKRYMLLQGMRTLTVVAEEEALRGLTKRLKDERVEFRGDLASVVVTSPREIVSTPGVIAHIASLLALEGINVVEMMSSSTETSFIVDEKDALKAVDTIRKEIKRAREKFSL